MCLIISVALLASKEQKDLHGNYSRFRYRASMVMCVLSAVTVMFCGCLASAQIFYHVTGTRARTTIKVPPGVRFLKTFQAAGGAEEGGAVDARTSEYSPGRPTYGSEPFDGSRLELDDQRYREDGFPKGRRSQGRDTVYQGSDQYSEDHQDLGAQRPTRGLHTVSLSLDNRDIHGDLSQRYDERPGPSSSASGPHPRNEGMANHNKPSGYYKYAHQKSGSRGQNVAGQNVRGQYAKGQNVARKNVAGQNATGQNVAGQNTWDERHQNIPGYEKTPTVNHSRQGPDPIPVTSRHQGYARVKTSSRPSSGVPAAPIRAVGPVPPQRRQHTAPRSHTRQNDTELQVLSAVQKAPQSMGSSYI